MSVVDIDEEGNETVLFVSLDGGFLKAMVRAETKELFDTQSVQAGLQVVDPEGNIVPARGVDINGIGPLVIPSTDPELPPEVIDSRYHANIWLNSELTQGGGWKRWAYTWSLFGEYSPTQNSHEVAKSYLGIDLINPNTIDSPKNVKL